MVIPVTEISLKNLRNEVLHVTSETSDKFVYAPQKDSILVDLLIGLKRFRDTVRWKWYIVEEKRKKKEKDTSPLSQNTLSNKFSYEDSDSENEKKMTKKD